jgi:hypothetical protein
MKKILFFAAALMMGAHSAHAAVISDKDAVLVCALVDLASCVPGNGCERETYSSINAPQLVKVDLEGQAITANRPDGGLLSTSIERVVKNDTLLVLDGVQNELSWTMTITKASGRLTLAAIGDGQAYEAFGSCETK